MVSDKIKQIMKIGYARVSTVEQNEARQMEALREEGVDKIYMDKKSGKDFNRPEYQKMISKGAVKKEQSPKKERPRVYNELKVFLSVIINLQ